jgi:hypothetical protein
LEFRPRSTRKVVAHRPRDPVPVRVVDDQQGPLGEVGLDQPETLDLRLVVVSGVVVVHADPPASERAAAQERERVALQQGVVGEVVTAKVRLQPLAAALALRR